MDAINLLTTTITGSEKSSLHTLFILNVPFVKDILKKAIYNQSCTQSKVRNESFSYSYGC